MPLHRTLFDRSDWLAPSAANPACNAYAWMYIVAKAQHARYEHAGVVLERGEVLLSVTGLQQAMKWKHRSRASKFLDRVQAGDMIEYVRGTPRGTVYRVVKYELYAAAGDASGDVSGTPRATGGGPEQQQPQSNNRGTTTWPRDVLDQIAAVYGAGEGQLGTDVELWYGRPSGVALPDPEDRAERQRLLRLAAEGLQTEGKAYQRRTFRATLAQVIREQHGNGSAPRSRGSDPSGAVDRLMGGTSG